MSIGQIVSNEKSRTRLILFGDTNHQRLKNSSHLDWSTGVHWKCTKTPLPAGIHLDKSEEPVALNTKTYYQQMIGTLIYAAIGTRPDIAFAAMRLSRFNNNPTEEHIKYAKYVLKYLQGTKELKIKYDGSSDARLIRYSDSDWGENRDDCHSTSGHVFLVLYLGHLSDKKWSHCQWEKLNTWN